MKIGESVDLFIDGIVGDGVDRLIGGEVVIGFDVGVGIGYGGWVQLGFGGEVISENGRSFSKYFKGGVSDIIGDSANWYVFQRCSWSWKYWWWGS